MEFSNRHSLRLGGTALLAGLALAVGACSGGSTTALKTNAPVSTPVAGQSQGSGSGSTILTGAVKKLSDITSYKFTITMKGGSYGDLLGNAPMTGTVVLSPNKASDVTMMGMEVIEVDGNTYVNLGSGSWVKSTDSSQTSVADSLSPEKMFGSYITDQTASGYHVVGDEQKNGVQAVHYTADANLMSEYGSMLGVEGGTWTADVWIAKDGGYPVSVKLQVTGGSEDFLFSMDITNVNDPANKIVAPI